MGGPGEDALRTNHLSLLTGGQTDTSRLKSCVAEQEAPSAQLEGPAGQGCADEGVKQGSLTMSLMAAEKTSLFQKKIAKKCPKTGSSWIVPLLEIC